MTADQEHDEDAILASTLSTGGHPQSQPPGDGFQRVNVLFSHEDLKLIDEQVHALKALGFRWVNRSLLIRHALSSLKEISARELSAMPTFIRFKK